jgi:hypothetical protein
MHTSKNGSIKEDKVGGTCSTHDENAYSILDRMPEDRRPLGIPRHKLEDNIKSNLRKMVLEGVDRIHLARDRDRWQALVNMVVILRVPFKLGNFLSS